MSRAESEEAGEAALCLPRSRRALSLQSNVLHDANAQSPRLDTPHVPRAAGPQSVSAQLSGLLRLQSQELLGHPKVREQDFPNARHFCVSLCQGLSPFMLLVFDQ